MARVLQLRRGTTAENNLFTGAVAEATYDTDRKELRVHDGSTVGGKVVSAPTGAVMAFAGSSAPEGWLVCDGSAVSRTTYADLFAVIGTTHGAGDGNTTFNLPNQTPTHKIIETQEPIAGNNYTWYRLYDDGFVEQGSVIPTNSSQNPITVILPISMADAEYTWNLSYADYTGTSSITWRQGSIYNRTATSFDVIQDDSVRKSWEIKGMSTRGTTQQNIVCIKY